jgi:hypothetical protein
MQLACFSKHQAKGLQAKGGSMRRALAVVIALIAIQTLAACATAAGAVAGGAVGATQGKPAEGAAIGAGVGAVIDIVD